MNILEQNTRWQLIGAAMNHNMRFLVVPGACGRALADEVYKLLQGKKFMVHGRPCRAMAETDPTLASARSPTCSKVRVEGTDFEPGTSVLRSTGFLRGSLSRASTSRGPASSGLAKTWNTWGSA